MKLLVLTGIFPPEVGGPATYVPRVASGLQKRGWEVAVATARGHDRPGRHPFPVHRFPGPFPVRLLQSALRLRGLTRGCDLTYVNGMEFEYALTRPLHRTPYVLKVVGDRTWERYRLHTAHRIDPEAFQGAQLPARYRLERAVRRRIARSAAGVVVPSHYLAKLVRRWGVPDHRIGVIHNAAHPPETGPTSAPSADWPGEGPRLLTAGRMVPWKRVPDLIGRVAPVEGAGLIVLGDGPEAAACRRAAEEHGIADRVVFRGTVDRATVWEHMRACDLFLLHSTYEGFPHVLLEAMATGTPVLASGAGGTRELAAMFPDRVCVYDRERPQELTRRLRRERYPSRGEPSPMPASLRWPRVLERTADFLERRAREG